MSEPNSKNLQDLKGFDALIAKRAEVAGGDGTTFPVPGFGKTWHLVAPDLADTDWTDDFYELQADFSDGAISVQDYRTELVELFLGDQAEAFTAECEKVEQDPMKLVNLVVAEYSQERQENPTRSRSRNTRKRAKRR